MEREAPARTERRTRRRKLPWGFLVAGVAIAGAIIYLVIANTGTTAEYYMTIAELRACHTCATQTVRVLGDVGANSVVHQPNSEAIRFTITQGKDSLLVEYNGIVPDIFHAGIQVVVEGRLSNGVFQARTLLAKCPSKFTPATPGAGS